MRFVNSFPSVMHRYAMFASEEAYRHQLEAVMADLRAEAARQYNNDDLSLYAINATQFVALGYELNDLPPGVNINYAKGPVDGLLTPIGECTNLQAPPVVVNRVDDEVIPAVHLAKIVFIGGAARKASDHFLCGGNTGGSSIYVDEVTCPHCLMEAAQKQWSN